MFEEVQISRVFIDLPGTDDVCYGLRPVDPGGPIYSKIVRKLLISPVRQELTPGKHVALGIEVMLVGGGPGPHQDLEDSIKPAGYFGYVM